MIRQSDGGGMVQGLCFISDDPGALPRQRPGRQSPVDRGEGTETPGLGQERGGYPGADGQDPGNFFHCRYFRIRAVVGGGIGWGHSLLQVEGLGRVPGFQCGVLGFQCRLHLQSRQPKPIQPPHDIHHGSVGIPVCGRSLQFLFFEEQRLEGSHGGTNALHR